MILVLQLKNIVKHKTTIIYVCTIHGVAILLVLAKLDVLQLINNAQAIVFKNAELQQIQLIHPINNNKIQQIQVIQLVQAIQQIHLVHLVQLIQLKVIIMNTMNIIIINAKLISMV